MGFCVHFTSSRGNTLNWSLITEENLLVDSSLIVSNTFMKSRALVWTFKNSGFLFFQTDLLEKVLKCRDIEINDLLQHNSSVNFLLVSCNNSAPWWKEFSHLFPVASWCWCSTFKYNNHHFVSFSNWLKPLCISTESLKLQRNTDNYLYLRNNHSNPSVWHQSDKEEFLNTKVIPSI
jgi:hypothetical protein